VGGDRGRKLKGSGIKFAPFEQAIDLGGGGTRGKTEVRFGRFTGKKKTGGGTIPNVKAKKIHFGRGDPKPQNADSGPRLGSGGVGDFLFDRSGVVATERKRKKKVCTFAGNKEHLLKGKKRGQKGGGWEARGKRRFGGFL